MLFREKSLFIVRTIRNTQIHSMGRIQSFSMLKEVVCIVATVAVAAAFCREDHRILNMNYPITWF
jgi:hypothetical protein